MRATADTRRWNLQFVVLPVLTRNWILLMLKVLELRMWSASRPGVATTTCGWLDSSRAWLTMSVSNTTVTMSERRGEAQIKFSCNGSSGFTWVSADQHVKTATDSHKKCGYIRPFTYSQFNLTYHWNLSDYGFTVCVYCWMNMKQSCLQWCM